MQVRAATDDDAAAIRGVAQASLRASYSLSPTAIEGAIQEWYGDLPEKLEDDEVLLVIAEEDDEIVAFAESVLVANRGEILWLHVDPVHRGRGIGKELYTVTRERLESAGAKEIHGLVLEDNAEGNDFYERQGLVKAGERTVEIDGDPYIENVYVEDTPGELVPISHEDRELYVDHADGDRGSMAPFFVVYTDPDRETKWGYYCGNCDSPVTSMDSMGRMECAACGNHRKPTRWDAAYL